MFTSAVHPVYLAPNPVDRNPFQTVGFMSHNILLAGAVNVNPINGLVAHICVIEALFAIVEIQSDHVFEVHFD